MGVEASVCPALPGMRGRGRRDTLAAGVVSKDLGAYRVLSPLGRGGMASVYLAEHRELGHRVAIKVLRPEHVDRGVFAERFLNEARAIARLRHPSIVELVDFGRDDKAVYFVMEHLEGESLSRRLAEGPLGERAAAHFGKQIASALEHAHEAGIVHRDLKPGNIFLVRDSEVALGERVKVLDFGIAKQILEDTLSGAEQQDLTGVGMLVGTPAYMSPEQCLDGRSVDHRSDIYSLGVLLYRMVTGTLPFESDDTDVLVDGHTTLPPDPPNRRNSQVSARMSEAILRCLAKDPDKRFKSMRELAAELEALADAGVVREDPKPSAHPVLPLPAPDDTRDTMRKGVTVDLDENLPTVVEVVDDIDDSIAQMIADADGSNTDIELPQPPVSPMITPRRLRHAAIGGALVLACGALLIMLLGGGQESASAGAPSIEVREVDSEGYLGRRGAGGELGEVEVVDEPYEQGADEDDGSEPSTDEVNAMLDELATDTEDELEELVVEPEAAIELEPDPVVARKAPAAKKRPRARRAPRKRVVRRKATKRKKPAATSAKKSGSKDFDSVSTPALF